MFSTDFFQCIFVQQAFEPTGVEHLDVGCLYHITLNFERRFPIMCEMGLLLSP